MSHFQPKYYRSTNIEHNGKGRQQGAVPINNRASRNKKNI